MKYNPTRISTLTVLLLIVPFSALLAQKNIGGIPVALELGKTDLIGEAPFEIMPQVNIKNLIEEDKTTDTIRGIPFRFGENLMVEINPENSGIWNYFEDGSRIWQVGIKSPGAVSLNLAFSKFKLPEGARLFVYTPDGKSILGAFTNNNNQEDGYFATTLLPGDEAIIEYYEPLKPEFEGELNLWRVTHGYRGPGEFFTKGFGGSGSCNLNVACDASEGWENQIRSVGMLVTGGNGFCTGSLINNTENDGTPLFLSANHCYSNPSTLVFWFNWQSETCANPTTVPPHDAMSGAVDRARHAASDFWLMDFNQEVPEEYNIYYSGWNRSIAPTIEGIVAGIHHPRGDIKKFSWADGGVASSSYLGAIGSGTTHWRVGPWSGATTTEPGSSGSPIFDSQGRIIGQLHGGYAACGNTQPDWYGRLGVSWSGGGTAPTRLSTWLDPLNTGVEAIFGYDPILDAADPMAPAAIDGLAATPAAEGALSVQLTWTNPHLTFDGEPLTDLDSIKIYRNQLLIHIIENPAIGQPESYSDESIEQAGIYNYELRATNAAGDSPPAKVTVFVGPDVPGRVTNITLIDLNNNGYLTWDAPTAGLNMGYFLPESITEYQITRNPDNVTITVDGDVTGFLDEIIPGMGFYSYTITAVNEFGTGGSATSEEVLLAADGALFMTNGSTTSCEGTFFDSGGPGVDYTNNENLTFTLYPGTEGAKINIQFTSFNTELNFDYLYVYDSDQVSQDDLVGQFSGSGVPQALTDLTSTHPTGALTFRFTSDVSVPRSGWEAAFTCFIPSDDDLAAPNISGNTTPTVGIETIYTVTVENKGYIAQSEYQVILETEDGTALVSVPGISINPSQSIDIPLAWTPITEGSYQLRGVVELAGDANPENNSTNLLNVEVLPEGLEIISVGDDAEIPEFRIPIDFYWKNGLTQTIYYDDELNSENLTINGISLFNQFLSNISSKNIKVWLQHTNLETMTGGFVPVSEGNLVFDGDVNFPSGENDIFILFDEPFEYSGGNILMTIHRVLEDQYYSQSDKFYVSFTPEKPSRTIQFNSDQVTVDPTNPPTTGSITLRDALANTAFYVTTGTGPQMYSVTFDLDMSLVPDLIFNPASDQVYLAGSMSGWAEPGTQPENQLMTPSTENPDIYTITLELEAGNYVYKYFINNGWDGGEWSGDPNRELTITGNHTQEDAFAFGNWEYGFIQFVNNAPAASSASLSVWISEKLVEEELLFRHATPYIQIPANRSFAMALTISSEDPANALLTSDIQLTAGSHQIAVIAGISDDAGYIPDKVMEVLITEAREQAIHSTNTDILIFHGATDAPEVSIWDHDSSGILATVDYAGFSGYLSVPSENITIDLKDAEGASILASYLVPLADMELAGEAILVAASGFLNPASNSNGPSFGLWVAGTMGGEMIPLPVVTSIDGVKGELEMVVFPNPANDKVTVTSAATIQTITLTDNLGRVINHIVSDGNSAIISTQQLKTGIYFLMIVTTNERRIHKLIVE